MISTVASLFIAYWIYQSSISARENPWKWIIISLVVFYASMQTWSSLVLKPLYGREFYQHSMGTAVTIEGSSVLIGLLIVALIRFKFILRKLDE